MTGTLKALHAAPVSSLSRNRISYPNLVSSCIYILAWTICTILRIWILQTNVSDVALIDLHLDRFTKWKEEANMKDAKKIPLENLRRFLTSLKNRYGDSGIYVIFKSPESLRWPYAIGIRASSVNFFFHLLYGKIPLSKLSQVKFFFPQLFKKKSLFTYLHTIQKLEIVTELNL